MKKPKYLYHGSAKKLKVNKLTPRPAKDLLNKPENLHTAVYATDIKEVAIAAALINCKGVKGSTLYFTTEKPYAKIYGGWPEQEYIYLYTLPSKTFIQEGGRGSQYYSEVPVKPLKVEKLAIKDYLSLINKATKKERENFLKKYKSKK